jgi:hypothetical protein
MSSVHAPTIVPLGPVTWTGTKMLAWGPGGLGAGGQYDVASDTWAAIPDQDAPVPRPEFTAVQAGSALIVWGGGVTESTAASNSGLYKTGGLYCPCATGANLFRDTDGDGHGDPASAVLSCGPITGYIADGSDCNDAATSLWSAPSDTGLLMLTDATHLEWSAPPQPGGTAAPAYDLLRSSNPDFRLGSDCRAGDLATTSFEDLDVPPLGELFYYRVRAGNACGEGVIGYNSADEPISGPPVCP